MTFPCEQGVARLQAGSLESAYWGVVVAGGGGVLDGTMGKGRRESTVGVAQV